ncbi:hypothetical protein GCM10028815_26080 [Mariniluteicoccus flavus]
MTSSIGIGRRPVNARVSRKAVPRRAACISASSAYAGPPEGRSRISARKAAAEARAAAPWTSWIAPRVIVSSSIGVATSTTVPISPASVTTLTAVVRWRGANHGCTVAVHAFMMTGWAMAGGRVARRAAAYASPARPRSSAPAAVAAAAAPTARRTPTRSMSHDAGSDSGRNAAMKIIENAPIAVVPTPKKRWASRVTEAYDTQISWIVAFTAKVTASTTHR